MTATGTMESSHSPPLPCSAKSETANGAQTVAAPVVLANEDHDHHDSATDSSVKQHATTTEKNSDEAQPEFSSNGSHFVADLGRNDEEALDEEPGAPDMKVENDAKKQSAALSKVKDSIDDGGSSQERRFADSEQNNDNQQNGRRLYTKTDLCSIARQMPGATCNSSSHREMLFGLFLQSSTSDLELFAKKSGARLAENCEKQGNRKRARRDGGNNASLPPPFSLVPLALSTANKHSTISPGNQAPIESNENGMMNLKRSDLESLSLWELEAEVLSKFESSTIGRKAIATENSQYSWFFKKNGKELSAAALPLVPQKKKKFFAMSMVYNECSMSAFAKFAFSSSCRENAAAKRGMSNDLGPVAERAPRTDLPSSTSMFHRCQVCGNWGHYELECEEISRSDLLSKVAGEVTAHHRLQHLEEQRTNAERAPREASISLPFFSQACDFCKSRVSAPFQVCNKCDSMCHRGCLDPPLERDFLGEWLCPSCDKHERSEGFDFIVDIEGCEGFVIEQRKLPPSLSPGDILSKSLGIEFSERSWSRVVSMANTKALSTVAVATKPAPVELKAKALPLAGSNHDLAVGEFCWAKREHSAQGKLGRDEWWPAQVMSIITYADPKSASYFSMEMTPYLVRLFGITYANRVRASSILPFFKNFRAVGYSRLSAQKQAESSADRRFRRGVEEVISLMGFKSTNQVLVRADEIVDMKQKPVSQPQRKRPRPPIKLDGEFTTFKQDGFAIRARESERKVKLRDTSQEQVDKPKEDQGPARVYNRTKLAGCVVAWMSRNEPTVEMKVGTVLAANVETKMALVSAIPQWETKLRPTRSKMGVVVHDYQAAAAEWIAMKNLHMISNGPDVSCQQVISEQVVAKLLGNAREKAANELEQKALKLPETIGSIQRDAKADKSADGDARQIKDILDERNSYAGRQYLIQWKELPAKDATWESEGKITNQNFVLRYKCDQLIDSLSSTPEIVDLKSTTYAVVQALKSGKVDIEASFEVQTEAVPDTTKRICPFCYDHLKDLHVFADHIKIHQHDANYAIIREAARLTRVDWYRKAPRELLR